MLLAEMLTRSKVYVGGDLPPKVHIAQLVRAVS